MIVSDLNALELVKSTEVVGGFFGPTYYENDVIKFYVKSDPKIKYNSAVAVGYAEAYGKNTFTKVDNYTYTTPYSSYSEGYAFSVSA